MPLIKKPEKSLAKKQIRVRLNEEVIEEIQAYCNWQDLPSTDYFIEQSIVTLFEKDKDWQQHKGKLIKQKEVLASQEPF